MQGFAELMMIPPLYLDDGPDTEAAGIDCDQSAADFVIFTPPCKCSVVCSGLLVTETSAGATTTAEFKFDKRPTAGSDTGRGDGDVAHIKLGTTAAGNVVYAEPAEEVILLPGQEVVCEMTQAATGTGAAGHVRPMLLVRPIPERPVNISSMVETA